MKCDNCKKEVNEWVKIPELKIEVQRERHSLGKAFKDIVVPRGLRLLTVTEAVWLCNSKYAKELGMNTGTGWYEYIEQPFEANKGKWAAWFGCNSNSLYLDGNNYLNDFDAARGVRFVRSLK